VVAPPTATTASPTQMLVARTTAAMVFESMATSRVLGR
jgi:hypothetical protein